MLNGVLFALVDLETTGGQPAHDEIMEVAVRLVGDSVDSSWQSLLNPRCAVPSFIQGLTGISPSILKDKPTFNAVQAELWTYLDNAVLVAHNARFDAGFLRVNYSRVGREYQPQVLCTLKLARVLYPDWPKHGLEAICHRIGFYSEVHHRAMADVDAMKAFLDYARADRGEAVFNFEVGLQLGLPVLPPSISQKDIDAIPCQPGIYRLLGETGELLYLGSAESLQEQVLSHFTNSTEDSKATKLARRVCGVQWQMLSGALSAGLYLSRALRAEQPEMQRRAKATGRPCCVRFIEGDNGGMQLRLRSGLPANITMTQESLAVFRDRKHAKTRILALAAESGVCLVQLGVLADGESCECSACIISGGMPVCLQGLTGVELADFNLRAKAAFAAYLYVSWPFDEPVLIYEQNESGFGEWHLIHDWRHYGSYSWDANLQRLSEQAKSEADVPVPIDLQEARLRCEQVKDFQYEHYRLLRGFIDHFECLPLSEFAASKAL
ncbi:exonuclease domain-containing protein [Zhongshania sp.]|jgi:DNA polymerase-3 subunit epsilon|uniref:3'-5' exonuclease family protein n=1 Tax=Zhongshania sp. TaxID=1971902 RepID=UPI0039E60FB2